MEKEKIARQIAKQLKNKKLTIAVAESLSGGLIAFWLTKISGSSSYFRLGVVPYYLEEKHKLLGINLPLLNKYQGVSAKIAQQMAESVRKKAKSDIGLATTGFAGPKGGTKYAPCGTVFIAVSFLKKTYVYKFRFSGSRGQIREKTLQKALTILKEKLDSC